MKLTIINSNEIFSHPTLVLSAEYWVNVKQGKLPFNTNKHGKYICSHVKNLTTAIYMTESEAKALNISLYQLRKAKAFVKSLKQS